MQREKMEIDLIRGKKTCRRFREKKTCRRFRRKKLQNRFHGVLIVLQDQIGIARISGSFLRFMYPYIAGLVVEVV
jgi:hypothetical protein